MLDETYTTEYYTSHSWTLGRVGEHDIVIACLPSGQIGTNSAAVTATEVRLAFPSIHVGLLVGIGGGVPSDEIDIRLGDVAVSQPQLKYSGVIQYDMGKSQTTDNPTLCPIGTSPHTYSQTFP